jgi:hypothetical protein
MTFEEELRRAITRIGDFGPGGPVPDLMPRARQRAQRQKVKISLAMVTAIAIIAVTVWAINHGPKAETVVASGAAAATASALPSSPLSARSDMASVWTGQQWLVWGGIDGHKSFSDGADYDPATKRWTMLPPSPLQPRFDPVSVWTGQLWLIWGGTGAKTSFTDGAAYDPQTRSWQVLPASTLPDDGNIMPAGVWTGAELIVVTSTGHAAAYEPSSHRWLPVPTPPGAAAVPEPHAVWTGSLAIFLLGSHPGVGDGLSVPTVQPSTAGGGATDSSSGKTATPPTTVPGGSVPSPGDDYHLAAFDPLTDRWRDLPPGGLLPESEPDLIWTGQLLLTLDAIPAQSGEETNYPQPGYHHVVTPAGVNAAYDPRTGRWTSLPPLPSDLVDPGPISTLWSAPPVWTGANVILWAGGKHALTYNPGTAVWSSFPTGGGPEREGQVTAWTGSEFLGWGGTDAVNPLQALGTGIQYRPAL